MDNENKSKFTLTEKLFGGLNMNWLTVLLLAVGTAAITAVFLIVPLFKNTSFERMGVTFEAWILFAVIIMANCKKPLESAVKTIVFFLVSQPLIYLIQVPFSEMGWGLFGYYKYWFIWTLLTFPMAFVGWYITKKNWLSVLILSPVLAFLGLTAADCVRDCLGHFPHLLVTALFCVLQIVLYVLAFTSDAKQKICGALIPVIAAIVFSVLTPQVDLTTLEPLPDERTFSKSASVSVDDTTVANIQLHSSEEGIVYIRAQKYGTTAFTVTDGDKEYHYTLEIYDDEGVDRTRMTAE